MDFLVIALTLLTVMRNFIFIACKLLLTNYNGIKKAFYKRGNIDVH